MQAVLIFALSVTGLALGAAAQLLDGWTASVIVCGAVGLGAVAAAYLLE